METIFEYDISWARVDRNAPVGTYDVVVTVGDTTCSGKALFRVFGFRR